jgi:type VI secretion system FHA domain protein
LIPEGWLDEHPLVAPSAVKDRSVSSRPTKEMPGPRSDSPEGAGAPKRPGPPPGWKPQGAQPSGGRPADQRLPATGRDEAFGDRARPPGVGPRDLAAVLAGAGLEVGDVTPELAMVFGQILRVVVTGVIDVLHARQSIRDEFRIGGTMFEPQGLNNPLKFSTSAQDALYNLLVKRSSGYLGPVEAFEDAFEDLKSHEIAMLEGMRVAFEMMLEKFNPDRLQKNFDQKGARLPMVGGLRYWEQYRERFHDMVKDADSAFRELFGEEFASAYDDQLKRLKKQRRGKKTRKSESSTSSDA